ncbi:hypothetical protein FB451DRAFT_1396054 [Mycena latifolia]|nr:hypothetical protein FB451DRAFT_1396054 [Mycena latifolia]
MRASPRRPPSPAGALRRLRRASRLRERIKRPPFHRIVQLPPAHRPTMPLKALLALAAVAALVSGLAPPAQSPSSDKSIGVAGDAPPISPRANALAKDECTGYCEDATCGPHCCCYVHLQLCFPKPAGKHCPPQKPPRA